MVPGPLWRGRHSHAGPGGALTPRLAAANKGKMFAAAASPLVVARKVSISILLARAAALASPGSPRRMEPLGLGQRRSCSTLRLSLRHDTGQHGERKPLWEKGSAEELAAQTRVLSRNGIVNVLSYAMRPRPTQPLPLWADPSQPGLAATVGRSVGVGLGPVRPPVFFARSCTHARAHLLGPTGKEQPLLGCPSGGSHGYSVPWETCPP